MRSTFLFCVALSGGLVCDGAVITGTVTAEGKPAGKEAAGKYESRKFKFVETVNYAELHDFVVFVEGPVTNFTRTAVTRRVLTQKDAMFKPHVLPIAVGTTVEWPNEDDIYHNVFSMSEAKPFDLGLYKAGGSEAAKRMTFDKAGRVDVFCSIHSAMHCIVLVLENPFFAITDARNRYVIKDIPPGIYKLKAWHERLPPQTREIVVPENGEVKADFTLGIANLPKY